MKRKGRVSIDEASANTGLAKTTLREHFLQLERDGYINRDYIRSGPGRPSLQYRISNKGNSLFPSSESELIKKLLSYLKEQGDEQTIEDFFNVFWEERLVKARRFMDEKSEHDLKKRLQGLTQMLEDEGFMPEFELSADEKSLSIKECNCPFSETIKETRLPCKLEAMFYRKLFNESTERTTYIADGDYACNYEISLNSE